MTAPADAPHPAWAWGTAAAAWGEARDDEFRFGPSERSMFVDTCLEVTLADGATGITSVEIRAWRENRG